MNYELTQEQKEIAASFGTFCRDQIAPRAGLLDEASGEDAIRLMRENLARLADNGYFRCLINADLISRGAAGEELAKSCGATFLAAMASATAFGVPIGIFGSAAQRERYLPALAAGKLTGCLAYTEAEAGSDLGAIQTRASRQGGNWLLNGAKDLVTNAPLADAFLILAWTDEAAGLSEGLTFFLVDRDTAGLTTGPAVSTLGLRGAPIAGINLSGCLVADDAILGGQTGQGFTQLQLTLAHIRLAIATLSVGLGVAAMEDSTSWAKTRRAFGKPIGIFEGVGAKLAHMFTLNDLGRLLTLKAAWAMERNDPEAPLLSAAAKVFTSESAREIAHLALQVHGGHGYLQGTVAERLYRDARFAELAFGTSELLRGEIAKDSLDRFREA